MAGIALCNHSACSKKETCFRYMNDEQGTEYVEFKHICCEGVWQYFWNKGTELAVDSKEK